MTQIQPSHGEPLPLWLAVPPPDRQRRWTVLIRLILMVPHVIVLFFLGIAAAAVMVIGWVGALFTGRLPAFAHGFLGGVLQWQGRLGAYQFLLTDRHPPYQMGPADYPVQVLVPPAQRLNRAAVLFRIVLAIPAAVVAGVVEYGGMTVLLLVHWLITLVRGRPSGAFHGAYTSTLRLQLRYSAYLAMLTPAYPWHGLFGDQPAAGWPGAALPAGGWPGAAGAAGPEASAWQQGQPAWPGAPGGGGWAGTPAPAGTSAGSPVPDVFTYGGATHLWGYTADRQVCGIWRRDQPGFPAEWWPIERQDEAWRRFRELEPAAVEYRGPAPAELGFSSFVPAPGPAAVPPGHVPGAPGMPGYGTVGGLPAAPAFAGGVPAGSSPALVLGSGSRVLLVIFIVLGAVGWVGIQAVRSTGVRNALNRPASDQLQQDYGELKSATDAFQARVNQCSTTGDLACVTAADLKEGDAFARFGSQLGNVTVVGNAANRDLSTLQAITTQVTALFRQLGAVTTPAQYQQIASGSQLTTLLNSFDATYNQLQADLGGSS